MDGWRLEYSQMVKLKPRQLEILEEGAKSLSQAWLVGAMHSDWKKKKGIISPPPPDCSSSLQEWESSIKKYK